MHKSLFIFIFTLFFGALVYIVAINIVYPHTFLSQLDVSGKSKRTIAQLTADLKKQPVIFQIKDRIYKKTYGELGIDFDEEKTIELVFEKNMKKFPFNLQSLYRSFFSQRMILPSLIFTQDFYAFTKNTIFDFSIGNDTIEIDDERKKITYVENEERYTIEPQSFKKQILLSIGKYTIIQPAIQVYSSPKKERIQDFNTHLEEVFNTPLEIASKDEGVNVAYSLTPADLKKLIVLQYDNNNERVDFSINDDYFNNILASKLNEFHTNDKKIDNTSLRGDVLSAMSSRFQGLPSNNISVKTVTSPNTSGEKSEKYIEIDISQQTMYLFSNNALQASYRISSGLYYPTPPGEYKIMNKAKNAFSDIFNVWMPYWMAFYYDPKLKAYLGIHELPYYVAENGNKVHRPREWIGTPKTGGCVSLDIGSAKEVFEFADIGTPVYIFN